MTWSENWYLIPWVITSLSLQIWIYFHQIWVGWNDQKVNLSGDLLTPCCSLKLNLKLTLWMLLEPVASLWLLTLVHSWVFKKCFAEFKQEKTNKQTNKTNMYLNVKNSNQSDQKSLSCTHMHTYNTHAGALSAFQCCLGSEQQTRRHTRTARRRLHQHAAKRRLHSSLSFKGLGWLCIIFAHKWQDGRWAVYLCRAGVEGEEGALKCAEVR